MTPPILIIALLNKNSEKLVVIILLLINTSIISISYPIHNNKTFVVGTTPLGILNIQILIPLKQLNFTLSLQIIKQVNHLKKYHPKETHQLIVLIIYKDYNKNSYS